MSNPLTYSDQIPTVPGWYFRRDSLGVEVVRLPKGRWPFDWEEKREMSIAKWSAPEQAKARANVKGWLVEYAGPIPEPIA